MIIKIHKAGRSFTGLCKYLTHDVNRAESSERVAWTHTLNTAHDDVASAVNEMLWTFRSADLLKREAGISTGGSRLEKPVKHISLSWPHSEAPNKEHMIETVRAYMEHMGWQDRQAVLISHTDKRHAHAHVVINSVSPLDGRAISSSHDWRRSEAFALQYEREHGQIHCEQRLKPRDERDATPTRENWQRFKKSEVAFDRAEYQRVKGEFDYFTRHDDDKGKAREWEALKAHQRAEREAFFKEGKQAYRSVRNDAFREVRSEFRGQWNAYYAAMRSGGNKASLAEMKLALIAAQNRALDERREIACDQLRDRRDHGYDAILAQQKVDRAELGRRQKDGLRTPQLMDVIYPTPEPDRSARDRAAWKTEINPAERVLTEKQFDRAGQAAIDPADQHRVQPGFLRRDHEPAAPTTDGFGRELRKNDRAGGRKQERDVRSVDTPGRRAPEMTDTASEKVREEKAREMTDQAAAKSQTAEVAALRASWNKSRWRSRD